MKIFCVKVEYCQRKILYPSNLPLSFFRLVFSTGMSALRKMCKILCKTVTTDWCTVRHFLIYQSNSTFCGDNVGKSMQIIGGKIRADLYKVFLKRVPHYKAEKISEERLVSQIWFPVPLSFRKIFSLWARKKLITLKTWSPPDSALDLPLNACWWKFVLPMRQKNPLSHQSLSLNFFLCSTGGFSAIPCEFL